MTVQPRRIAEIAAALFATVLFLYIAGHRIGIDPFDESIYLNGARWFHVTLMLRAQAWAPLYVLWYRTLAIVVPNPESRYFVNWGIMTSFLALVPVLLDIPGALVYIGILLTLPVMLPVPYVSLFAGWPILLGLCLLIKKDKRHWRYSVVFALAAIACFIGAFSRPELQDGVIIAAVLSVICLIFERETRTHILSSIGLATVVVGLAFLIHYAAQHTTGNRSGFAFVDSYNLRAWKQHLLKPGENPWTSTYTQHKFGLDQDLRAPQVLMTITDYFKKSPRLFLGHMLDNALDIRFVVLFTTVLGLCLIPWVRPASRSMRPASAYMATVSASAFLGILFIYPREHYAMSMFPTLILYAVYVLKPQLWPGPLPIRLAGFAVLLALCAWASAWRLSIPPFPDDRMHLDRLTCARKADMLVSPSHVMVYDARHGTVAYVGQFRFPNTPEDIGNFDKFKAWAAANNPGWISMTPEAEGNLGASSAQIDDYIVHTLGFVPLPCVPATDMRIFYNPAP